MSALPTAEFEPLQGSPEAPVPGGGGPEAVRPPAPPPDEAEEGPRARPADEVEEDKIMEALEPSAEPRELRVLTTEGEVAAVYVQKPLSYLRKMQFLRLIAKHMREAIDEGGPEVLTDLLGSGVVGRSVGSIASTDFDDAASFTRFILALIERAEDLLEEAQIIWLGVPRGQREWAKQAFRGDIEGIEPMSDEDGIAVLKTFIAQNWSAMQDFFTVHLREVWEQARDEQRRISRED